MTAKRLVDEFGANRLVADLRADDFLKLRKKLADSWSPVTLANEIRRVRTIVNYGWQVELIDKPIRFGPTFRKPSR